MRTVVRRSFAIPLAILGLIVVIGVFITFDYITLLFDPVTDNAIDFEVPAVDKETRLPVTSSPQLIPKIIHQTWKNETVPEKWREAQESCLRSHPDFEYKLWTDESARQFIADEYPWFLPTYDSYPHNIMRADAIRYFILAHFGGIYIDLDEGCQSRLDPLLTYPAWVRQADPTGVSNSVMGSTPNHPFFLRVMLELKNHNTNWHVPYITVMYATGPLFLSIVWKQYKRWADSDAEQVWILMPPEPGAAYFNDLHGSSWHEDDAKYIAYLGVHWLFFTVLGFLLAAVVGLVSYLVVRRVYPRIPLKYKYLEYGK
ncbi:nucleotide-diphospho-sugar transferase [Lipomyces kononenkoae]|uniref:Nucleotide-diphospho-sugar transferase n=1 Tax=Lipomyces kononenkoae TaxID=34357 RepID=A0ACC3T8M3_LIPKO